MLARATAGSITRNTGETRLTPTNKRRINTAAKLALLAPALAQQAVVLSQQVAALVPSREVQELPLGRQVAALVLSREVVELPLSQEVAALVLRRVVVELPLSQQVAARVPSQQKVAVAEIRLGITVSHPERVATLLAALEPREAQPKRPAVAEAPA